MGFDGAIRTEDGEDATGELHASIESRESETLRPFHPNYAPPIDSHVTEPEISGDVLHGTKVWLRIRSQNKHETWTELLVLNPAFGPAISELFTCITKYVCGFLCPLNLRARSLLSQRDTDI